MDEPTTYGEIAVDRETFDDLMRRGAGQTSRRAALATLVGGALLLRTNGEGEATKKAKRRKARKRRARSAGRVKPKPTWVWLENRSTRPVKVEHGQALSFRCCDTINSFILAPGDRQPVAATYNHVLEPVTFAYIWLDEDYWLEFDNPFAGLPAVKAAVGGRVKLSGTCCQGVGDTVLEAKALNVHEFVNITMNSRIVDVRRNPDMTNYKVFTVTLPQNF